MRIFPNKNHLAIGVPPWLWTPPCNATFRPAILTCTQAEVNIAFISRRCWEMTYPQMLHGATFGPFFGVNVVNVWKIFHTWSIWDTFGLNLGSYVQVPPEIWWNLLPKTIRWTGPADAFDQVTPWRWRHRRIFNPHWNIFLKSSLIILKYWSSHQILISQWLHHKI